MTLRVLLVDDEAPARRRLRRLLGEVGGATVVGEAEGGLEAIDAVRTVAPDVVLLDVQMPELDGIGVAQALAQPRPAIVFVTAHDEYAVKAFEVSAVDYLLKPVAAARLRVALDRAVAARPDIARLAELLATRRYLDRLYVDERGRIIPVELAQVDRIVAERNYVRLCTHERELLHRSTITALAAVLDPARFARVSRSAIVRLAAIAELVPIGHGDHEVRLRGGATLRWSRSYRTRSTRPIDAPAVPGHRVAGGEPMTTKYLLSEDQIPRAWYNILADIRTPPAPVLHPGTQQPVTPDDLAPLFPMALIEQEMSPEREIAIPDAIRGALAMWRPTPLFRAHNLERAIGTRSHIYYKYEGVSPAGSHKPNTAVAQAYYNAQAGVRRLATETGAGQWGSSLALAGALFGLKVTVYMVKVSYQQKPYRRSMMHTWGAEVFASPSDRTRAGQSILAKDPASSGSLGIAISEAVEDAATHDDTKYSLGSVLNHVLLHQTVIGQEAQLQMALAGEYPDVVIGCHGGGSNFAGIAMPFARDKLHGKDVRLVAAEPTSCPSLTKGRYAFDFGDTVGMTPLVKMYTLGHDFMPPSIHAGGLRYHGAAPLVSKLVDEKIVEAVAHPQRACFEAAVTFARSEGIIPAPESSHAIKAAIEEAKRADAEGRTRVVLFNLSGHGHFDLAAYDAYFAGKLEDFDYPAEAVAKSLASLPAVAL